MLIHHWPRACLVLAILSLAFFVRPQSLAAPRTDPEGFRPLFNGKDLSGWSLWGFRPANGKWVVKDGCLTTEGRPRELASEEVFGDFDLRFEWKISPGGNSGVMYRAAKGYHAPTTGPELQLLDAGGNKENHIPERGLGSAYAIYAAEGVEARPAGEWNTGRIVARGDHIEHWLNGKMVLAYELHTEDWKARVAKSKFAKQPQYGAAKKGYIILQDHGSPVWFRNIRIKTLDQH